MATLLKLGPADHGREVTPEEFLHASYEEGHRYELIDGRLYASPIPNFPATALERWVRRRLEAYGDAHPEQIKYVDRAKVPVPASTKPTAPEPDIAVYADFPEDVPLNDITWEDLDPVIVVEVLSREDPDKDLIRNVGLYLRVPSIREYWIIDGRDNADEPSLLVYRRRGQRWQKPIAVSFGETYATPLLPGFALVVDPHAR